MKFKPAVVWPDEYVHDAAAVLVETKMSLLIVSWWRHMMT